MSTAVQKTEAQKALKVVDGATEADQQQILASDMVLPKMMLMQGLSDFVSERAKSPDGTVISPGHLVRSTTKEILGSPEAPVEIVPLKYESIWMLTEFPADAKDKKGRFRGILPRDAGLHDGERAEKDCTGEALPWDFTVGVTPWRRTKIIRLYALLPQDILSYQQEIRQAVEKGEIPDLDKTLMPIVIDFKVTSYQTGRDVATHFLKVKDMAKYGAVPYGYTLKLGVSAEKNDSGHFFVLTKVGGSAKLEAEALPEAARWFKLLTSGQKVQVHEEIEVESGPAPGPTGEAGVTQQSKF